MLHAHVERMPTSERSASGWAACGVDVKPFELEPAVDKLVHGGRGKVGAVESDVCGQARPAPVRAWERMGKSGYAARQPSRGRQA